MKMKVELELEKNDARVKMLLMEGVMLLGAYRAPVEKQYDRLQRTLDR